MLDDCASAAHASTNSWSEHVLAQATALEKCELAYLGLGLWLRVERHRVCSELLLSNT